MTIFDNEPLFNLDAVEEKAGASDVAAAGGSCRCIVKSNTKILPNHRISDLYQMQSFEGSGTCGGLHVAHKDVIKQRRRKMPEVVTC